MPVLPDATVLGPRPTPSPVLKVQGYQTGQVASAVAGFGQDMTKAGYQIQDTNDNLQLAQAKAQWLRDSVDAQTAFEGDPDYKTYGQRYDTQMQKATSNAAGILSNPQVKAQFQAYADTEAARGFKTIQARAWSAERADDKFNTGTNVEDNLRTALQTSDQTTRNQLIQNAVENIDAARKKGSLTGPEALEMRRKAIQGYGKNWTDQQIAAGNGGNMIGLLAPKPDGAPTLPNGMAGISVKDLSDQAAAKVPGANPTALAKTAMLESSGNPMARNGSQVGMFQISPSTANQYGLHDATNPTESAEKAAQLQVDNKRSLTKTLGREPSEAELYLAHQQGIGASAALLKNPNANAVDALTPVYGSAEKATQAIVQNGGKPDMTAGDFTTKWQKAYEKAPDGSDTHVPYFHKTGTPIDYMDTSDRITALKTAQAQIEQDVRLQKMQKEMHDKEVQGTLFDSFTKHQLTPDMVNQSDLPAFGEGGKNAFLDLIRKGPNQGNPSLHNTLYQKVVSGEIIDRRGLLPYMAQPDGISTEEAQQLINTMENPDPVVKQFTEGAKSSITKSTFFGADPNGDARYSRFLFNLHHALEAGAKKGLSSSDMLDPTSSKYVGKQLVSPYMAAEGDIALGASADAFNPVANVPVSNSVPPPNTIARQPGETPAAYLQRLKGAK